MPKKKKTKRTQTVREDLDTLGGMVAKMVDELNAHAATNAALRKQAACGMQGHGRIRGMAIHSRDNCVYRRTFQFTCSNCGAQYFKDYWSDLTRVEKKLIRRDLEQGY